MQEKVIAIGFLYSAALSLLHSSSHIACCWQIGWGGVGAKPDNLEEVQQEAWQRCVPYVPSPSFVPCFPSRFFPSLDRRHSFCILMPCLLQSWMVVRDYDTMVPCRILAFFTQHIVA